LVGGNMSEQEKDLIRLNQIWKEIAKLQSQIDILKREEIRIWDKNDGMIELTPKQQNLIDKRNIL